MTQTETETGPGGTRPRPGVFRGSGRTGAAAASALVITALLSACANGASRDTELREAWGPDDCLVGQLAVQAMERETTVFLRDDTGASTPLAVGADPVITGLSGARMEVCGTVNDQGMVVEGYQLVSVDGVPAYMGTLRRRGDGWALDPLEAGRAEMPLVSVPSDLQSREGRLLWISVQPDGEAFRVVSFGALRS